MPELPEVETIVRGLRNTVVESNVVKLDEFRPGTVREFTSESVMGKIESVERRGKYILMHISTGAVIVVHLGMTGKLVFAGEFPADATHVRAAFHLGSGKLLLFIDPRTFGFVSIHGKRDTIGRISDLGVEPLSKSFDKIYLHGVLSSRKAPVKNLLMNQKFIAGIGNIYACEALHRSGIHPARPGNSLSEREIEHLTDSIRTILEEAIEKNGTSISDFRSVEDKTGEFQDFLRVYMKKKCHCGTPIERIKQAGRSSYFCPNCQK